MDEIVYVLGAGFNQVIKDWKGFTPPLLNNVFKVAFELGKFSNESNVDDMQILFDYIEEKWGKTKEDLAVSSYDLETCITSIELQAEHALREKKDDDFIRSMTIRSKLKSFLAEALFYFQHFAYASESMRKLAKILLSEKPTVITFNYDCILEMFWRQLQG